MADSAASAANHVDIRAKPTEDQHIQRFIPADQLMISCGCVPVDIAMKKVAIIYDHVSGYTQLPKGRKNIHEDLHTTAVRETCEETGLEFHALPLKTATRATPTAEMMREDSSLSVGPNGLTEGFINCEASSVCVYRCRDTGAFKMVFWFAAQGDCTAKPDAHTREAWEEGFEIEWVDAKDAASRMSDEADGKVIEKVLTDMRNTGYDI
ncbi:hypothetical protein NLG97_g772 [Lecanicillium saksenae]|uniref:Uncharacterized protein n=1 Tax=Lecanicillium saksenae TaxID=468837 RepID=A0ACC1R5K6_9HYPO|nr:hypothetical protein NLG97_g772 [Lecanicillium saksenae]